MLEMERRVSEGRLIGGGVGGEERRFLERKC